MGSVGITLSQLIEKLEQFRDEHGDLRVMGTTYMGTNANKFGCELGYFYKSDDCVLEFESNIEDEDPELVCHVITAE